MYINVQDKRKNPKENIHTSLFPTIVTSVESSQRTPLTKTLLLKTYTLPRTPHVNTSCEHFLISFTLLRNLNRT